MKFALFWLFSVWTLGASAFAEASADVTARFLAGLPVRGTPLEARSLEPAWADHATEFDAAWAKLEERQLARIRVWAPEYLGQAYQRRGPMFYMFSGPDFLYARAFFPHASTYILCGTEPVGPLPQIETMPSPVLAGSLATLRKSLRSVLNWSFFITKDMKIDLTQTQLSGTLPVLYVFLARAGCEIRSVESVALDKAGQFGPAKGGTPGVKIVFASAGQENQTLYYFTTDLSNGGIRAHSGFIRFCEAQEKGASLVKAASYLMHEDGFSKVREFLLARSALILQDDSGIPHRFFQNSDWVVRYCGSYTGPISLFQQYPQPDLARAHEVSRAGPIPFGFGYQWQPNKSSLLIAAPRR
jgi:hypothetical protein